MDLGDYSDLLGPFLCSVDGRNDPLRKGVHVIAKHGFIYGLEWL